MKDIHNPDEKKSPEQLLEELADLRLQLSDMSQEMNRMKAEVAKNHVRERLQRELQESRSLFQSAANAARMGAYWRNLQTGEDYWSPEILAIYGYGPNETPSFKDGIPTTVYPEDREKVLSVARTRLIQTPNPEFTSEHRIVLPNGEIRWLMIRGRVEFDSLWQPLRSHGFAIDITDRKRTEEKLQFSERRISEILESITDPFYAIDAEWRLIYVNRQTKRLWGRTHRDLIGTMLWTLFPDHEGTECYTQHKRAMSDRVSVKYETFSPLKFWAEVNIYPTWDGGLAVYFRDITERKKAEDSQRKLTETLEQQVAARTELAENRAKQLQSLAIELIEAEERERRRIAELLHEELQQDIAAARFQLQAIPRDLLSEDLLSTAVKILEESLTKARNLSYEMNPAMLDQSGLIAALKWLVRHMNQRFGFHVHLAIKAGEPQQFDNKPIKVFLYRATKELLFNAVRHSGVNNAHVVLSCIDNHLTITVSDQGQGFDPEKIRSTDKITGLGLLSIRERAQYIGGSLHVESAPGRGSHLTFSVPILKCDPEGPIPPAVKSGDTLHNY